MTVAPGKPKPSDVRIVVDDAPNISKLIRSDTTAFFNYLITPNVVAALKPYAKFEGVIQGDPHSGNVAPTPVRTTDGHFEMRMLTNDFDNVGEGAFVWEFVHNAIQAKAIDSGVKIKELLSAYLDGIDGKTMQAPERVQEMLDMSEADYARLRDKYVAKQTSGNRFIRKAKKIEDYRGPYTLADMQDLVPEGRVLDFAHRIREEGGNTGERIWILVQTPRGERIIKELKDYQETALAKVHKQLPLKEWSRQLHAALWPGLATKTYDVVTLKDGHTFWLRDKVVSLLDVPRSSDHKDEAEFRKDLLLYDANFFGLSAGSQAQGAAFAKTIRADEKAFRDAVKLVIWPYLKAAERALEK